MPIPSDTCAALCFGGVDLSRQIWRASFAVRTAHELRVGDRQVMQAWEQPIMQAMVDSVAFPGADVLEIGFGMNISADAFLRSGCGSYTVIEAHPQIAAWARSWGGKVGIPVKVIEGFWQDVVLDLGGRRFDSVLFDTCPIGEQEDADWYSDFLVHAPLLLRPKGRFTYFGSGVPLSASDESLNLLTKSFNFVRNITVTGLDIPHSCEYWSSETFTFATCYANEPRV